MGPIVAIIGRPNVGKSSLFNKIIGEDKAIIADFSGLTRDRLYGNFSFKSQNFSMVDTGGISEEREEINFLILQEIEKAIEEADGFIFLVDANYGLSQDDYKIHETLRKSGKKYILALNKSELKSSESNINDFYQLGVKSFIKVSAKNGLGIKNLKEEIFNQFQTDEIPILEKKIDNQNIKVSILGKPNAGKSTFFNSIIKENRSIVSAKAGTTRDAISKSIIFKKDKIELFDTAGLRKKSKVDKEIEIFSVSKAILSMRSSSGVLYLVDGKENITDQDLHLISLIISAGKPLILGINKSDRLSQYDKSNLTRSINKKLAFISGISIHYLSAKQNKGTSKVLNELIKLIKKSARKIDTSELNNLVEEASKLNPPQISGRFRPKIKYANLLSSQPTIIRVQGNNLDKLTKQYQKYLENYLRKKMNFEGIPIKLIFKNNLNPFRDKKNILTKKQLAKRKRISRR
tara:strand:- start:271 stop:1656 length:1386 start_codon:yes stop_codon:yes gene_type:complete